MADLVVEDGTALDAADTFVTPAIFVEFAAKRGATMTLDQASIHLVLGMDLLLTYASEFKGELVNPNQALPFPRKNLVVSGRDVPNDVIPVEIELAQMFAALASFNGTNLVPIKQNGQQVIKKKTGPLEKTFAYDPDASSLADIPLVSSFLALLIEASTFNSLVNVRV